ncbi:MAG TPA: UDP-glucose 4-epimerase GalE [Acidimicrobiales bacterium]|nr:UDP-glucose 4-epimerase GalE [Acidimicrobiales bacterium]
MMRVLVTGGAGYIGSVVAARLLEEGHEVTVLDDLSTGHLDAVPERATFVEGRIQEAPPVLHGGGFDGVVHLAASSLVAESIADPAKYEENNVIGTRLLLEAMREADVRTIVFSSSAAVYGEPPSVPIDEDAPTAPVNPYGASKLADDRELAAATRDRGLAAVSLRYFNVAGAYGRFGERHDPETHLIPLALQAAIGRRDGIVVYGEDYPTPDGTCIRDYIHVVDIADAHLLALDAARPGAHLVCNLGNGEGFSVREVLATVGEVTGRELRITAAARRAGDPAVLVASSERARRVLGWTPRRPALADMVGDAWQLLVERDG